MTKEEAIKIVRENMHLSYDEGHIFEALKILVPELEKSEDEKIRKWILDGLDFYADAIDAPEDHKKAITYLEKQKEQKPVISDEAIRDGVVHFGITQYQIDNWLKKYINVVEQKHEDWPKLSNCIHDCKKCQGKCFYRKEMYQEQKPVEWSEEDERNLYNTIEAIKYAYDVSEGSSGSRLIAWLKFHLRPQSHWRPSEEQMRAVFDASERNDGLGSVLRDFYNDLKRNFSL